MRTFFKILAGSLLLFNGTGALYGGWHLIVHPDGSSIQLLLHWLEHTPFENYLIPGIILFLANGVLSFVALAAMVSNSKNYPALLIAQGAVLTGWIVSQMLMIHTIYYLHIVMGITGISLLIIGWWIKRSTHT